MNQKTKTWLSAARLRTLPLSVSGILVGSALAQQAGFFDRKVFALAMLTTISFQVLSNFANDYGDGMKGTDNDRRIGPARALQSGLLTAEELKNGILAMVVLSLVLAIGVVVEAFGMKYWIFSLLFFALGIASVVAAIKYTVGDNAYGYQGLGDVFVFLFFGLLAVVGSYFLFTKTIDAWVLLPATAVGLLSAGVLHLNNMRDRVSDAEAGKNTLAVKLGAQKAKYHHAFLIFGSMIVLLIFAFVRFESYVNWLFLIAFVPLGTHLKRTLQNQNPKDLDPELKKLALSTFLLALLFAVGLVWG